MKFSEKTKHITCGVVMGAMLATAVPATASQITKSIQATYNNIKIIVDGQQVSTNKNNEPFIYNGTTYLPIRAVGEAVGKQVSWDGKTNTVYLGDSPVSSGEQYLMQVCPPYQGGDYTCDSVKIAEKNYTKLIGMWHSEDMETIGYEFYLDFYEDSIVDALQCISEECRIIETVNWKLNKDNQLELYNFDDDSEKMMVTITELSDETMIWYLEEYDANLTFVKVEDKIESFVNARLKDNKVSENILGDY